MKLNCRPGDLAFVIKNGKNLIVKVKNGKNLIVEVKSAGKIVKVLRLADNDYLLSDEPAWIVEQPCVMADGTRIDWIVDRLLRPIRGPEDDLTAIDSEKLDERTPVR